MQRFMRVVVTIVVVSAPLGPLGGTAHAAFPGGNGKVAWGSSFGEFSPGRIFTVDPTGANLTAVTPRDWVTYSPAWSADGSHIAFVRSRSQGGATELVISNPDGSSASVIVPFSSGRNIEDLSWSADDSSLAFCVFRNSPIGPHVFTVNANGTGLTKVTLGAHYDCSPSWSPDGNSIAMDTHLPGKAGSRIVTINPDGTGRTVIVRHGMNSWPDWSPDGSHLTFARLDHGGPYDIFTVRVDGTELTNITNSPSRWDWTPYYSPDGTEILYSRAQGFFGLFNDLWIKSADGTGRAHRLTNTPKQDEWDASWQPT